MLTRERALQVLREVGCSSEVINHCLAVEREAVAAGLEVAHVKRDAAALRHGVALPKTEPFGRSDGVELACVHAHGHGLGAHAKLPKALRGRVREAQHDLGRKPRQDAPRDPTIAPGLVRDHGDRCRRKGSPQDLARRQAGQRSG